MAKIYRKQYCNIFQCVCGHMTHEVKDRATSQLPIQDRNDLQHHTRMQQTI
uniref:Uncharacterized protein n=1 Tax=Anguilla anguilla TaxID=7936 RepID=A0A0E9WW28_ANGAN